MTEPGSGPRRLPLPLLAAVAIAVALAIGIPVGLASGADRGASGSSPRRTTSPYEFATSTPAPPPTTTPPTTRPPTTWPPTTRPPTPPTSTPPTAEPPPGLTSAQRDLWDVMEMEGVYHQTCAGYPPGATVAGVVAALQCEIKEPSIAEPIIYYEFSGAAAVTDYLQLRAREIDRTGDCADGDEGDGPWQTDGVDVGWLVCVDNVKNGTTYFKMVFSSDTDRTVVIVQDESAAALYAWWRAYAAGQFYGIGEN